MNLKINKLYIYNIQLYKLQLRLYVLIWNKNNVAIILMDIIWYLEEVFYRDITRLFFITFIVCIVFYITLSQKYCR